MCLRRNNQGIPGQVGGPEDGNVKGVRGGTRHAKTEAREEGMLPVSKMSAQRRRQEGGRRQEEAEEAANSSLR